jgi:hypothetical protein
VYTKEELFAYRCLGLVCVHPSPVSAFLGPGVLHALSADQRGAAVRCSLFAVRRGRSCWASCYGSLVSCWPSAALVWMGEHIDGVVLAQSWSSLCFQCTKEELCAYSWARGRGARGRSEARVRALLLVRSALGALCSWCALLVERSGVGEICSS